MVPDIVNLALVVAYVLLLGVVAVRYRRGAIDRTRLTMYLGLCLTWLAYGLLQITQEGIVETGTPLNYALDGLALVCLVAGLFLMYRWWRERGRTEKRVSDGESTDRAT
ncbi:hypothetical protein ACFQMA_06715 [Halosimplex aquaticum]|uniref:PEP-CTERM protein-sorting domain-containing protein n=1 Tax=Halosimplex aquaticum TaxID=3026162 RepID=A0ABD5XWR6_9EURY|nr:hypothetical protein [Halosimplex aquaticum]